MADEEDQLAAALSPLSSKLKIKPYVPTPSFWTTAGQTLGQMGGQNPPQSREEYFTNLAYSIAGNLLQGQGAQEERQQSQDAYSRLAGILASKNAGEQIARDPYWYDAAPSLLLDTYERQGKIKDKTAIEEMVTQQDYLRKMYDVDPVTHQATYFPGYIEQEKKLAKEKESGNLQAHQFYDPIIAEGKKVAEGIGEAAVSKMPFVAEARMAKEAPAGEDTLSNRYENKDVIKNMTVIDTYVSNMIKSLEDTGPASHNAYVYGVPKLLDVGSTVMQGEQDMAQSLGGIQALATKAQAYIDGGQVIPEDVRVNMLALAKRIHETALKKAQDFRSGVSGVAERRKLDPRNIFMSELPTSAEEQMRSAKNLGTFYKYQMNNTPGPVVVDIGGGQQVDLKTLPAEKLGQVLQSLGMRGVTTPQEQTVPVGPPPLQQLGETPGEALRRLKSRGAVKYGYDSGG